jgi:hypothetical protein
VFTFGFLLDDQFRFYKKEALFVDLCVRLFLNRFVLGWMRDFVDYLGRRCFGLIEGVY